MASISVCMIVKNEEDVIGRCLECVSDLFDEIIIDNTKISSSDQVEFLKIISTLKKDAKPEEIYSKIDEMLDYFDNETEHGLLLLSYPMVEAIRHFRDIESFKTLTVKCKRGTTFDNTKCQYKNDCTEIDDCLKEPHYKALVAKTTIQN
mgnify:CR=1 FL=1